MPRKVKWGILGAASIAQRRVLPAMRDCQHAEVVAVASRSLDKARSMASQFAIPKAYGAYEDLLGDPEVEAIYNPLPNHLHVAWSVRAARGGKHVLCEKPLSRTVAEVRPLLEARDEYNVKIGEAFMVRNHPQWQEARKRAQSGALGEVRAIQVFFSYHLVDPANVRNQPDIGEGGLLDIGCYPVVVARDIFGAEPLRAIALIDHDPNFKIDRMTTGIVDFGQGRRLDFTVSTQSVDHQRVDIVGSKGRLEVPIPFNAPQGKATRLYLDKGQKLGGAAAKSISLRPADQYRLQGEAFSRAVRGIEPLAYGIEDSIRQMRVLDALFRSAETGKWETI